MNKTNQKNRLYFFFSLIFTLLITACGVRNYKGFVGEDAHFANYVQLEGAGEGTPGLAYYADSTNPNEIAVGVGTCQAEQIRVTTYNNKPVTQVFPAGFHNCTTIRTIILPDTVTTFGTDAFAGSSLVSIEIPNGLTVISTGAFRNCKDLTTVTFKTEEGNENNVTTINDYAFANDYNLSTFAFHNIKHLTYVGKEAFLYCLSLRSVIFPDSFTTLESYAFQDCKGLATIYFGDNVTSIGAYAFKGVGESAKIYFSKKRPQAVSALNIDDPQASLSNPGPFEFDINLSFGSTHLQVIFGVGKLKVDGPFQFSRPESGTYTMNKCSIGDGGTGWKVTNQIDYTDDIAPDEVVLIYYDDDGRSEIEIPSVVHWDIDYKVVGIKNDVFRGNENITSVTIGENLRFIDYRAFSECPYLKTVNLEKAIDLQHIQSRAFYHAMPMDDFSNNSMYSLHIPPNVQNIGIEAFRGCTGLFKLYFDGATNEYEETFITDGSSGTFNLAYIPSSITAVRVAGPAIAPNAYNISGKTLTLNTTPAPARVVKVKYTTKITTTEQFVGHMVNDQLVSEFTLSAKVAEFESVKINGVATNAFTTTEVGDSEAKKKTKITFTSAPGNNAVIVVSYRAASKLTTIDKYAFEGCFNDLGTNNFNGLALYAYHDPYQKVYFPASLGTIGLYAFANTQFIGGVVFQSSSLTIGQHAFYSTEGLSSIVFPNVVTSLILNNKSFGSSLGAQAYVAGNQYKKLISVTLPANTTVNANEVFAGHYLLSIYCIGNLPNNYSSKTDWNKIGSQITGNWGDFSGSSEKRELDWAPTYVVDSAADIVTLPNKEFPVFDFVKRSGESGATLANYHYYGGRIQDQDGDPAISPGVGLNNVNNTDNPPADINSNYNSKYAVMIASNAHFRFEIPAQVKINGSFVNVTEIGQSALAFQMNASNLRPNNDGNKSDTQTGSTATLYWKSKANYWTMREIDMPHSIKTIGDGAIVFVPFTTVRSYDLSSADFDGADEASSVAKLYVPGSNKPISADDAGKFPRSLETVGKVAFSFSALTKASLPSCLREYGGITSSVPPNDLSYCTFPFMGCFDLSDLGLYTENGVTNSGVFTSGGGALNYATGNVMIEGAEGIGTLTIPWGTTTIVAGAVRGGRNISTVQFPYTVTAISNNLLDAIGSARDSTGRSGRSNLTTVTFEKGGTGVSDEEKALYNTSRCTSIGSSAFWGCYNLKNVELPVGLTTLNDKAFNTCNALNNITIDKGTSNTSPFNNVGDVSLGSHLNCTELPDLSYIGVNCFNSCKGLTQLTTSTALSSLSESAFNGCTGLGAVTLNSATSTLGNSCFYNCSKIPSIEFNNGTSTKLGSSCFEKCSKLASATFNSATNEIGVSCFNGCTKLDTVTFAPGVSATFKDTAFNGCTSLRNITIPSESHMYSKVFAGCSNLTNIIVGAGATFHSKNDSSAFFTASSSAKIFLMDSEETYLDNSEGANAKYPSGWNCWDYSNSSGSTLDFYCYSEENVSGDLPHWRMVAGVPTPW